VADRSTALLKLLRGGQIGTGLYIVTVNTSAPLTFVFEGSDKQIDADLFEIPAEFQPLTEGARYFALPILGKHESQRWGLIQKIDGPTNTKTFITGGSNPQTVTVQDGLIKEIK
jgi:hypothetical protein